MNTIDARDTVLAPWRYRELSAGQSSDLSHNVVVEDVSPDLIEEEICKVCLSAYTRHMHVLMTRKASINITRPTTTPRSTAA